jgi:DNA (cytosine-5)-methyltransferase 1
VDIEPQPHYPFPFWQGDALQILSSVRRGDVDAIHASPPCQAFSALRNMKNAKEDHIDLLTPVRPLLARTGVPFVIENVPGAPMRRDFVLCGTMFGLGAADAQLRRHRWFEVSFRPSTLVPPCSHTRTKGVEVYGHGTPGRVYRKARTVLVNGNPGGTSSRDALRFHTQEERCEAMGIDWMNRAELAQAIPPAYTEFLGRQLLRHIGVS